jgi:N-formylmaleamate deformylase
MLTSVGLAAAVPFAPIQSQSPVDRSAARFSVVVSGHGRPMLLIPGVADGGRVWDGTVAAFKNDYECHVFTLAGFAGQPPVGDGAYLPAMRDAIVAYVREHHLAKPVIVGHSLGGFLALSIAASAPDLPGAVINVDGLPFRGAMSDPKATAESALPIAEKMRNTMHDADAAAFTQMQDAQLRTMVRDTTRLPLLREMARTSDRATVAEATYELYITDLRPGLARVKAPVLNLHSWAGYASYGMTHDIAGSMFGAQYTTLATGTTHYNDTSYHFIQFDAPEWLYGEMRAFLNRP